MGAPLPPRIIRAGPYLPTANRTGNVGDQGSFRMNNLIVRGRNEARFYWETYSGERDLSENVSMTVMTGTLALTQGSDLVIGTGTLFMTECPYIGMRIAALPADNSATYPLFVKRVVDDTHMYVWAAQTTTVSSLIGWLMPRLYAVNDQRGVSTWGDVLKLDKGSFLGAGLGTFYLNGQVLPGDSLVLSRRPSIALYDPVTVSYSVFELGMNTSAAPALAAVGGGTKMQGGNYSLVITPARKETFGYNNPSDRADVTIATNDKIQITFPAMDTTNGQNAWKVWVTTFADTLPADLNYLNGPWHYFVMIDDTQVSPAGGTFEIEYYDTEVENNEIVSFNNDAPTDAAFVEMMNAIPVWLSCQGQGWVTNPEATSPGPFIVPAKPTNIEAAPLDLAFSSSPPETIIGAVTAQGRIYLLTTNHLQIAQSTPSDTVPIIIRPFWHSGFACPEQIVFVNGILYGVPVSGPTKSAGDGDESIIEHEWAADVYEITKNWNPGQTMIGVDPKNNMILLIHTADHLNDDGFWTTRMLGFGLSQGFWVFDRLITDTTKDRIVCGVATVGDSLELLISGRVT